MPRTDLQTAARVDVCGHRSGYMQSRMRSIGPDTDSAIGANEELVGIG